MRWIKKNEEDDELFLTHTLLHRLVQLLNEVPRFVFYLNKCCDW